jgi:hypothetical protein
LIHPTRGARDGAPRTGNLHTSAPTRFIDVFLKTTQQMERAMATTKTNKTNASVSTANQPAPPPATLTPITGTANGSNHGTKVNLQTSYQALITGLLAFYQPTDEFTLKSGTYSRDGVIEQLQRFITAAEATKASHTVWRGTVQTERDVEAQVRPIRVGVRGIVGARYGADGTQMMQFGFQPAKRTKKSAQTKAQAVVKGKATRTARATKGKNQKKAIKAPAAPAVAGTPASGGAAAPANATGPSATHSGGSGQ